MQNIITKVLNYIYYWNTIEFINGAGSCATVPISRLFPVYYRGHEWKRTNDNLSFLPSSMFISSAATNNL